MIERVGGAHGWRVLADPSVGSKLFGRLYRQCHMSWQRFPALLVAAILSACVTVNEPNASSTRPAVGSIEEAASTVDDPVSEAAPVTVASASGVWVELAAWPLERRSDAAAVWTGRELVVWGGLLEDTPRAFDDGARYEPAGDEWVPLPESPLSARSRHVGLWTGSEVIFWGGIEGDGDGPSAPVAGGAAYDPAREEWRLLADGPLQGGAPAAGAWTGSEALLVGTDGAASYRPETDTWAELAPRPGRGEDSAWMSAHWSGSELLVVSSAHNQATVTGYDPVTDEWRNVPAWPFQTLDMPVTRGSPTHVWDGERLWLWTFAPQDTGIAGFDPHTGQWVITPPFPGRDCTDIPAGLALDGTVLGDSCNVTAILTDGQWDEIPAIPHRSAQLPGSDAVWTGREVLFFDAGIHGEAANFPGGSPPHFLAYKP